MKTYPHTKGLDIKLRVCISSLSTVTTYLRMQMKKVELYSNSLLELEEIKSTRAGNVRARNPIRWSHALYSQEEIMHRETRILLLAPHPQLIYSGLQLR